jgi:hypothetical protein
MRSFAQKQAEKPVASGLARPKKATSRLAYREHPSLFLQHPIGNQAVQRMLQTRAAEPEAGLTGGASPRFGHDFSQIPLLPPGARVIQAKLAINQKEHEECSKTKRLGLQTKLKVNEPGDLYEQVADRIADQVMATPAHPAVSGGPPRIQRFSEPSNGQMDAAPASVDQSLASPGSPLEPALRQDMEQRFKHDFSMVRVHSGAAAERSARDVNAHAYTVGHNIVLGADVFRPQTHEGRRLIAHELTHVLQQVHPTANTATGIQPGTVQRDPKRSHAKQTESDRIEAAIKSLKTKYGLGDITEEHGTKWSESELKKIDASFSKMSKDEQEKLKGVALLRTDKLSVERKGKKVPVVAMTSGHGGLIQFTQGAFLGDLTTLHEAGHVIQANVIREVEEDLRDSDIFLDLGVARANFEEAARRAPKPLSGTEKGEKIQAFNVSINAVTQAAGDLMKSDEDSREDKQTALDVAQSQADVDRTGVESFQTILRLRHG